MKLGAVIIPATTLLATADLRDRIDRGHVGAVIARSDIAPTLRGRATARYLRIAVGEPVEGWLRYSDTHDSLEPFEPDEPTDGRRAAAALLHLRHDRAAQAGRAHPRQLPDRPSVDDVLDRAAAGRRAPERLEPGLGQARLVVRVRAVDRRRDDLPVQLRPLRRAGAARRRARREGDDVLRTADGVADARPAGPRRVADSCRCANSSARASRSTPR